MVVSKTVWVVIGASLLSGGVGGFVGHSLAGSGKKPDKTVASAEEPEASEAAPAATGDADSRLASLERKVARLERQRQIAQAFADPAGQAGGSGTHPVDDPVFETAVRDVLERVDEERDDQRRERRTQRIQQISERWSDDLAKKLALSEDVKKKVAEIIKQQFEEMANARNNPDAGRGDWRDRMREQREKTDKALSGVLTPAQMEQMRELREQGELPGFGGGGWRRRSR